MSKIVTLGEIMLRLSPEGNKRFVQVDSFDVIWGGVACVGMGSKLFPKDKVEAKD